MRVAFTCATATVLSSQPRADQVTERGDSQRSGYLSSSNRLRHGKHQCDVGANALSLQRLGRLDAFPRARHLEVATAAQRA